LIVAAMGGQAEVIAVLLAAGAEINGRARDGATALIKASLWRHAPVVAVLLRHGAEVAAEDDDGWTALKIANEQGGLFGYEVLQLEPLFLHPVSGHDLGNVAEHYSVKTV